MTEKNDELLRPGWFEFMVLAVLIVVLLVQAQILLGRVRALEARAAWYLPKDRGGEPAMIEDDR